MATDSKKPKLSFAHVISENVECLAIAIVMALVLKFFLVEAYKIPSGSMQPTIMGDQETKIFDRVLVNKLVYFLREPKRWEVSVFKMPLIQTDNYIKRIVGLPGENIWVRNGDIYVTTTDTSEENIARKPNRVWNSVRKQMFPSYRQKETAENFFRATRGTQEHELRRRANRRRSQPEPRSRLYGSRLDTR